MLEEVRIRDLGVIEEAVLELAPGLTVVTGETGAGKTMVVQGLGLLLGARADAGRVRPGAARTLLEGRLAVDPDGPVAARVAAAGGLLDDGELLLARTVSAEGRSRAHVGGTAVPVAVLAELAELLVAVHGQSDQHRLLRSSAQRDLLDRYAGPPVAEPLQDFTRDYTRWRGVESALADLHDRERERLREADLLRAGLAEVQAAEPQPDELAALAVEIERLSHAEALREAANAAHALLAEDDDGTDGIGRVAAARRVLDGAAAHDPALAELTSRVAEVGYLLADVAGDLASYLATVDTDPTRLASLHDRKALLDALVRRYAGDPLEWAQRTAARLAELDGSVERAGELAAERVALQATLARTGTQLSAARAASAATFATAVGVELAALAMPQAAIVVRVTQRPAADGPQGAGLDVDGRRLAASAEGLDDVEVLLQPHPGAPLRPLARGASGGELSRVMLAAEVVLAGAAPTPTFVFDEVDAGVGGRAAVEVGRRLARLAEQSQVVVVTHLPQVAAYADRHLLVRKESDGRVTRSGVCVLDDAGRVRELSRMLAGLEESALAQGHAEELLAAADAAKRR